MALDNETKSPTDEPQEKKPTEVPAVDVDEVEKIKTEKESQNEKLTEKIEDQKIIVPMEEMNPKDVEPTIKEDTVTKEVNESKDKIPEEVAEIIAKNVDELVVVKEADPYVTDDEKEEKDPIVYETQPAVPADEIAMKKDTEMKEKKDEETKVIEPLKIEDEPVSDVQKDDEAAENSKQEKTVEALESKENKGTDENVKEKTDLEKPALEDVKTGSKEDKRVDEIKLTDSTPKEEEKSSPKESSYSFMGKMKKSFMKAKKAISGKNSNTPTTTTTTATKNPETKEDNKT